MRSESVLDKWKPYLRQRCNVSKGDREEGIKRLKELLEPDPIQFVPIQLIQYNMLTTDQKLDKVIKDLELWSDKVNKILNQQGKDLAVIKEVLQKNRSLFSTNAGLDVLK